MYSYKQQWQRQVGKMFKYLQAIVHFFAIGDLLAL